MSDSVTSWTATCQAFLSITNSQSLLKLMSIKSVMPSNHLVLCCPLLLPPSIFPSSRVFSNESVLHIRWSKYWSFSFSISPSNEYSRLIFFRMDWLNPPVYFTTCVGVFLSILFSWSVFVFMPVSHQFHYCSFVTCFEFRKYEALTFVLLFPDHFLLFRALLVPYEC